MNSSLYILHAAPITLVKCPATLCEASEPEGDGYAPRLIQRFASLPKVLKNRVGAHRWEWGCEEARRALLCLPPVLMRSQRVRGV
jgi:hypothetical protein